MTQFSRPLQVALAAAGLLVVVWFVALRGHSSSSEPTATTPASSASSPSASSSGGGGSSSGSGSVYHGSAPGVEGLTRDIQKAHGAVAQSEQNAAQVEQKSAQASGEGSAAASGGTAAAGAASATHSALKASATKTSTPKSAATHKSAARTHTLAGTSGQTWVEHQLARKFTVALLFYSPHAYDDSRTRRELQTLIGRERRSHVKIVLRVAPASSVGAYGAFTRVASIYQTPTVLLVTPPGVVKQPITGLTDAFSIEQAIDEKTQQ